jgi:putative hydrolase of the HAD superfamily
MLKAVIFDFGNVLDYVDDAAAWEAHVDQMARTVGLTGQALWQHLYDSSAWQAVKRGRITPADFWRVTLTPFGITDHHAQQQFAAKLLGARDAVHPAMLKLLHELRPHYKLAVLSNTDVVEMASWLAEHHGLTGLFDVVVSSAAVGLSKPEAEIYELTLRLLNVMPHQALFIDDRVRNTAAAEALGIPSIVFTTPDALCAALAERGVWPNGQQVGGSPR